MLGRSTTTIVAFLPLMFVQGIMGKFIYVLPAIVICALTMSLSRAVHVPRALNNLPDPRRSQWRPALAAPPGASGCTEDQPGHVAFITQIYAPCTDSPTVSAMLRSPRVAASLETSGLFQAGSSKCRCFRNRRNVVTATVESPTAPAGITRGLLRSWKRRLNGCPRVKTLSGAPWF